MTTQELVGKLTILKNNSKNSHLNVQSITTELSGFMPSFSNTVQGSKTGEAAVGIATMAITSLDNALACLESLQRACDDFIGVLTS